MLRIWLLSLCPLLVAMVAAPVAHVASRSGQHDGSNVYVVIDTDSDLSAALTAAGARDIGPQTAPFARLMYAEPVAHAKLIASGFWVIPASALAALCGLPTTV